MKKIVLTFALITGGIMIVMMWATLPFAERIGFNALFYIGYTTIVLSFMLVFFGIRSYRENVSGGEITFGRAFAVGILITLISSVLYVISWEIMYFGLPGFAERFVAMCVEHIKSSGASPESIKAQIDLIHWYDNPFYNAALTFAEPFPIGLIVTLISSLILKKRPKKPTAENQVMAEA